MGIKAKVGAGAVVIRNDEVLLVQMNYGKFAGEWILPGGLVEEGEEPAEAVLRELQEETNQNGKVVAPHSIRFRKNPADIYWVFIVELASLNPILFPKTELLDAKFWPIESALSDKAVRPMTKYFVETANSKNVNSVEFPGQHLDMDTVYFFNS